MEDRLPTFIRDLRGKIRCGVAQHSTASLVRSLFCQIQLLQIRVRNQCRRGVGGGCVNCSATRVVCSQPLSLSNPLPLRGKQSARLGLFHEPAQTWTFSLLQIPVGCSVKQARNVENQQICAH